jgi:hypothetical protein
MMRACDNHVAVLKYADNDGDLVHIDGDGALQKAFAWYHASRPAALRVHLALTEAASAPRFASLRSPTTARRSVRTNADDDDDDIDVHGNALTTQSTSAELLALQQAPADLGNSGNVFKLDFAGDVMTVCDKRLV